MSANRPQGSGRNPRQRRVKWLRRGGGASMNPVENPVLTPLPSPGGLADSPLSNVPILSGLYTGQPSRVTITCIDFSPDRFEYQEVANVPDFLDAHRPEWSTVRWINVSGFSEPDLILAFADKYNLHPLAVEDLFNGNQRPKAVDYPGSGDQPGRLFVLARMIHVEGNYLCDEQICFFMGRRTLLTFQEGGEDVFESIRQRIKTNDAKLRRGDVSILLYALLDTIVDRLFPLLEVCSDQLEILERIVLTNPHRKVLNRIHRIRRELLLLRRAAWPMREVINQLQREPRVCLSEASQVYFRDVYNNLTQIIDLLETYRDFAMGIAETYMSSVANRMNEIMKTLTIITTIFVPLTFLAGVYGMNMPIPENASSWSYPIFWTFCFSVAFGMLYWFRSRDWF